MNGEITKRMGKVSSRMLTETATKGSGQMTNLTVMELIYIPVDAPMKESGKMISSMGKGVNSGLMDPFIKGSICMEKNMG